LGLLLAASTGLLSKHGHRKTVQRAAHRLPAKVKHVPVPTPRFAKIPPSPALGAKNGIREIGKKTENKEGMFKYK